MHAARRGAVVAAATALRARPPLGPAASTRGYHCRCWAPGFGPVRAAVAADRTPDRVGCFSPASRTLALRATQAPDAPHNRRPQQDQMQQMQKQERQEARDRERQKQEQQKRSAAQRRRAQPQGEQGQSPARRRKRRPRKKPAPSEAEIKEAMRTQIEYYFSDFMLPATDTKLASLIAADNDSWVPLDVIARYTRMAELAAQLVDFGPAVVVDALEGSALLEMNRARTAVRRRYRFGEQGNDFVPLDEDERRTWHTLCAFKTAPVQQSSSGDGGDQQTDDSSNVVTVEMSFPPQTAEQRAVVHRLAHILGLQHQSKGKGAKNAKHRYVIVRKRVVVTAGQS
jgi:hypothetical protein